MELGFLQETKSILKSLVVSSPNGMTLERLNRDYRDIVGNWIPFQKLGFPNLELFLRSIPDTLVVTGCGLQARVGFVVTENVSHINEMVSRQKNTTRERKSTVTYAPSPNAKRIQQPAYYGTNYKEEQFFNTYCGFNKSNIKPDSQNSFKRQYSKKCREDAVPRYEHNHRQKTSNANNPQVFENKDNSYSKPLNCKPEAVFVPSKIDSKNMKDQNISDSIIRKISNPIDSRSYDLNSSELKMLKQPDFENRTCIYDKNKLNQVHGSKRTSSHNETIITQKEYNINSIVFPCKQTSKITSQKTSKCDKVMEKNEQMQNEFEIVNPFSQNNALENSNDMDEAVPEFAANSLVFRVDCPEHTVGFGQKIPRLKLPAELVKGAIIGVFISEIHSPFKFWFHIYKENHELDILMNRIELFYSRLPLNELAIPRNCLAPGHVCAALYNDMWHRAEVLSNACNNKVKVIFFDYGTVSEIDIRDIKYLPEMFSHTPMQAIRGSLSHIKPASALWSKTAVRAFLSMVSEILLYAQIIDVDEKEQTVYMVLCDTNGNQTLQINKQMVDKGYAKLDSEWDENKIAKSGYRKRHPRDIFPTFEMLETGEYPSLSELENLLAQGIDYEMLTEKIILSNVNNNNEYIVQNDCENNTLSFNLLDTNPFKNDIISEILSLKIFGE